MIFNPIIILYLKMSCKICPEVSPCCHRYKYSVDDVGLIIAADTIFPEKDNNPQLACVHDIVHNIYINAYVTMNGFACKLSRYEDKNDILVDEYINNCEYSYKPQKKLLPIQKSLEHISEEPLSGYLTEEEPFAFKCKEF